MIKQNKNAIALVELIVVISIIAAIVVVIVPVNKTKREIAQNTLCKSNLQSIVMAAHLWSIENDDWVLPGRWDRGYEDKPLIKPYLGNSLPGSGAMLCPAVPAKYAGKTYGELGLSQDFAGLAAPGDYYNSYGLNQTLCNQTSRPLGIYDIANENGMQWGRNNVWYSRHGNVRLSTVYKPSEKVMFGESILYISLPWIYNKAMLNPEFRDPAARGRRHFVRERDIIGTPNTEMCGLMNIAWIDGSVSQEPEDFEVFNSSGRGYYEIVSKYWVGDPISP